METASLGLMIKTYNLLEKDCDREVSDSHLKEIACFRCENWKTLLSHLEIAVGDSDISMDDERKILAFFSTWKMKEGSNVTYKKLVDAFLRVGSRDNAEEICKLLVPASIPESSDTPEVTLGTEASTEGMNV